VVQKDKTSGEVKVTKVEGGGLGAGSNTTNVQADPIKDRIIVLILEQFEEEIAAWLRINGKGGEDDPDVLLAEELTSCFKKDAGQLKYLKDKTIPYFKTHVTELRAKIEASQTRKTLFDKIAALFKSKDDLDWTSISADDQEASRTATCEALMDDIAPLISLYEKAKPLLLQDEYKDAIKKMRAIYEFFKTCNGEGWESYKGEGIIPYCFWKDQVVSESLYYSNADLPFTAGLIDGVYNEAEGIYHLPQLAKDMSKIPGKLLYAYTKAYFDCRTSAMIENVEEYEYILAQLQELEDEEGIWAWSKEKYYESQSEDLVEYFKDCKDADELRETVNQLYEIVTSWEEIKTLYTEVQQRVSAYLKTLDKTGNIGRYERGKLVVPVTTTVLTLGAAAVPKVQKLKNVLKGLKEASTENWKKVTEGIGKLVGKSASDDWISLLFKNVDLAALKKAMTSNPSLRRLAQYLSIEEEAVIKYYTTNAGYKNFNQALRGEIPMTQEFISQERLLNQALDKLPISVYNGEHTLLYRIEDLSNELISSIYTEGQVVELKSFISATYSRDAIKQAMLSRPHSYLIRIQGKNGKLIEEISTLSSEREILFKSNSKFRVKKVDVITHPLVEDGVVQDANEIIKFNGIYRNHDQIRVVTLEQL
jgi:hypothetical protein